MESPSKEQFRISESGGGKFADNLPERFQLLSNKAFERVSDDGDSIFKQRI
jgi:hypothetical protein